MKIGFGDDLCLVEESELTTFEYRLMAAKFLKAFDRAEANNKKRFSSRCFLKLFEYCAFEAIERSKLEHCYRATPSRRSPSPPLRYSKRRNLQAVLF